MLRILITTTPDDVHAIYALLALRSKGCKPIIWYTADYPVQQKHNFEIINGEVVWQSCGEDFEINNDQFDIVWYRRPQRPTISPHVHPSDIENSQKENGMLYQAFWEVIANNAIWINPAKQARSANCKILQLRTACQNGLKIPSTLISNDPQKIKQFIESYGDGNIIYKTLYPLHWITHEGLHLTYTNKLSKPDLPSDYILQSTAGIFQKRVDKLYELRVTYFGEQAVAVKIETQHAKTQARIDWRSVPTHQLQIKEYKLPDQIDRKCRQFMKQLGLIFGCFDFIKTPDNEYIFLEVNEAGQFLWIEDANPDIKMLNTFTNFILNQAPGTNQKSSFPLSLADFKQQAQQFLLTALKTHQNTHILN